MRNEETMIGISDLHTHTLASTHAYSTISENAFQAKERGILYLAMTDHGPAMEDAPHRWHFANLKAIPEFLCGVKILKGVEANILPGGRLDLEDGIALLRVIGYPDDLIIGINEETVESFLCTRKDRLGRKPL